MDTKTRCWMCGGKQAIEVVGLGERYKTCPRCKGEGIITLREYVTPADELATLRARVATLESTLRMNRQDALDEIARDGVLAVRVLKRIVERTDDYLDGGGA